EDTAAGGIPSPITAESTQTTSAGTDEDLADLPGSEQPQDKPQREPTADENPTDEPTEVPKSEPPRGEDRPESTVARPRRKRPVLPSAHKPEKPDLGTGNAGARRFPVPPRKEVDAIRPEIGRASCREREESGGARGAVSKNKKRRLVRCVWTC